MLAGATKLFVVGGGPFQLDIIRAAKRLGVTVAVADRDPEAPGLKEADRAFVTDIVDRAAMLEAAREFMPDGVVTAASDAALVSVSAIGVALGLPVSAPEAVGRCRDKLATFETLRAASIAVPHTLPATTLAEAIAAAAAKKIGGFPLILKPRSAAGGRGVSVVRDRSGVAAAFTRASSYDKSGAGVLVQRFVGGHAMGVEAFFYEGQLECAFLMDDQFVDGFVSPAGHSLPSERPDHEQQRIRDDIARIAATLGLTDGPANFDLRLEGDETVLIEVNPRLGGNSITDLVRAAYGVDLSVASVKASLGADPRPELQADKTAAAAASRLIFVRGDGHAHFDDPFGGLADRSGVVAIELTLQDGDPLRMRVDDHAIVGRVVVTAATPQQAAERAAALSSAVGERIRIA